MSRIKCDSAVMFEFIISLVFIFRGVIIITSAHNCSQYSIQGYPYCTEDVEIKYPFWYDYGFSDISGYHCGYPGFGIKCVDQDGNILKDVYLKHVSTTVMNISNKLYHPSNIQYEGKSLRVKEMGIQGEECPHPRRNLSLQEFGPSLISDGYGIKWTLFYNCSNTPNNSSNLEQYHLSCLDNSGRRSYAFRDIPHDGFNWYKNCEQTLMATASSMTAWYGFNQAEDNYTTAAKEGFVLGWSAPIGDCEDCENSGGLCSYNRNGGFHKCSCESHFWNDFDKTCPPPLHKKGLSSGVKVLIGVFTGLGTLLVVLLLTYITYKKSNCKRSSKVETFLESCENLALQRYKYSDIKKMTNSFKETLGKGGYGCVFKGKLMRDGRLVAIKMLNESKGNGEDFMNEVATIGRTNHVNVVSLLGFCTEGTKRALVYEFMQNGSLERFIYNEKTSSTPLGWEKLYQIALGIARGLEYLHRGCNTRILHFDIKPHNILLDHEFCPKISDFGLAKLCPTRESVVSMLDARGTIGYIAPEVYCRNFGGVSHKSDVYSYGMMVFEIIGGRKNIDPTVENISEIYFPQWIYNHLIKQDTNVQGSGEILADETTKKMIIVASWCVQIQPVDRPSISKVVEMLEGSTKDLQMPPNPFQDPPSRSSP